MVHVYKKSSSPLRPWGLMRSAGPNTVARRARGKYLVLWNVEVVRRDGLWHYVFDFDARDSLEKSEIAMLMSADGEPTRYAGDADWSALLGTDSEVVDSKRKAELIRGATAGTRGGAGDVKISCMRVGTSPFPLPQCA